MPEKKEWIMNKLFIGTVTDENEVIEEEFNGVDIPNAVKDHLSKELYLDLYDDQIRKSAEIMAKLKSKLGGRKCV